MATRRVMKIMARPQKNSAAWRQRGRDRGISSWWVPGTGWRQSYIINMKGTKVQTLGGRAVAGAWLVAWAIMAMGVINTHAHR